MAVDEILPPSYGMVCFDWDPNSCFGLLEDKSPKSGSKVRWRVLYTNRSPTLQFIVSQETANGKTRQSVHARSVNIPILACTKITCDVDVLRDRETEELDARVGFWQLYAVEFPGASYDRKTLKKRTPREYAFLSMRIEGKPGGLQWEGCDMSEMNIASRGLIRQFEEAQDVDCIVLMDGRFGPSRELVYFAEHCAKIGKEKEEATKEQAEAEEQAKVTRQDGKDVDEEEPADHASKHMPTAKDRRTINEESEEEEVDNEPPPKRRKTTDDSEEVDRLRKRQYELLVEPTELNKTYEKASEEDLHTATAGLLARAAELSKILNDRTGVLSNSQFGV